MAKKLKRWLEKVYQRRICREFDNVVLVIGDEGMGKSNTIAGMMWWYKQIRGEDPNSEELLDQLVWNREEYKEALATWEKRTAIAAMDAARILHKKKAMDPDQIELETDMYDVRAKEHLIFLGFQDWGSVPSDLQERRAKHAIVIPSRGRVEGYNRESIDAKDKTGDWPEPDLEDTFPALESLDGPVSEFWDEFQELDMRLKRERILGDDDEEDEEPGPKEIADEISDGDISRYLSEDGRDGSLYVDHDMIALDYEHLSVREARQVRKLLEREPDVARLTGKEGEPEASA